MRKKGISSRGIKPYTSRETREKATYIYHAEGVEMSNIGRVRLKTVYANANELVVVNGKELEFRDYIKAIKPDITTTVETKLVKEIK